MVTKERLRAICEAAGTLLLTRFRKPLTEHDKTNAGWVTEADLASEALILRALREATPTARIVAEESGINDGLAAGKDDKPLTWYVDPLDGTTNFTRGNPYFSISIAGARGEELIQAAVYSPAQGEFFYARRGQGAWLDEQRLEGGAVADAARWVLATGDLYDRGERFEQALEQQQAVYAQSMVVRAPGSVALALAYVAAGRFDGFFFDRVNSWDVAAGRLLVEEAGGVITTYEGATPPAEGHSLLAGSRDVVDRLQSWLLVRPARGRFNA